MKRKILSLLLTFCLALIPGICVNAEVVEETTAPQPHMVDLSEYFEDSSISHDIFYDENETNNAVGIGNDKKYSYSNQTIPKGTYAFTRSVLANSVYVNGETGVLSIPNENINLNVPGDEHVFATSVVDAEALKSYVDVLPFDVSEALKVDANSAIMLPNDTSTEGEAPVITISEGFSGKPSKYLTLLIALSGNKRQNIVIHYADGTSAHTYFEHEEIRNSDTLVELRDKHWTYDAATGSWSQLGLTKTSYYMKLSNVAIDTDNKVIKSVDIYSSQIQDNNSKTFDLRASVPILAMTEIPSKTSDLEAKVDTLINGGTVTENVLDEDNYVLKANGDDPTAEGYTTGKYEFKAFVTKETTYEAVDDIKDFANYSQVKKASEIVKILEERGVVIDEKIKNLTTKVNAIAPHMIDLSSAFNADIFANEGDIIDSSWGYGDKIFDTEYVAPEGATDKYLTVNAQVGIFEDEVEAMLGENGIFSPNGVTKFHKVNTFHINGNIATDARVEEVVAAATPFDLSAVADDKNAVVMDKSDVFVTVNSGFSGRPVKYLLALMAAGIDESNNVFKVTYTDGKVKTYKAQNAWAGVIMGTNRDAAAINFKEKLYYDNGVATKTNLEDYTKYTSGGRNAIFAQAIALDGKPVKSIEMSTGDETKGAAPVLALTEIPFDYNDLIADKNVDYSPVTAETADLAIKATEAAFELYNRGYTDVVTEADYQKFAAQNKKANAVKEAGDDTIYVSYDGSLFDNNGSNVTANVKLTNTSLVDKDCILVIASYSNNGTKLLDINYGTQTNISSEETLGVGVEVEASVSVPSTADATYKLFVWEDLTTLIPIKALTE